MAKELETFPYCLECGHNHPRRLRDDRFTETTTCECGCQQSVSSVTLVDGERFVGSIYIGPLELYGK